MTGSSRAPESTARTADRGSSGSAVARTAHPRVASESALWNWSAPCGKDDLGQPGSERRQAGPGTAVVHHGGVDGLAVGLQLLEAAAFGGVHGFP